MQIPEDHRPGLNLLIIAGYVIGALFVFQFIGLLLASLLYGIPFLEIPELVSNPEKFDNGRNALMLMQGIYSFGAFIVAPVLFIKIHDNYPVSQLVRAGRLRNYSILLVAVIVVSFLFVNSIFIEWNAKIDFPDALEGFESWARNVEERAQHLTQFLTRFSGLGNLIVGIIVIAIIPAFGEELLFRGLIQNKLYVITKNKHVAIVAAALVFSAFHLQFFGFVPRFLLGVLFGYLYVWSGSLAIAMIAHFFQNGITLLMIYLYNINVVEYDIENTESVPVYIALIFLVITIILLFHFKNYYFKQFDKTEDVG